ncbi:MAG TPA: hypothetical protein VI386_15930, partial [Candidatus Sulfotelmatobacter sp.]
IEGKVSLDKTWGHLAYGCIQCCGYSPYLSPDTLGLGVGGDGGISAYGTNNCTGTSGYGLNSYFARTGVWWSGNTATAKVTSFNGHGVAPGATNGFATATILSGDGNPKVCPQTKQQGQNNIAVQVPTSATIIGNEKQSYSNQTWASCDGSEALNKQYGYQRCVTYQVNDQNNNAIQSVLGISEAVAVVDQNINTNMNSGNSSTNTAGQFLDADTLINTSALPSNACSIVKQSITATGNASPIRVNCLQYSSTDVTITDVTSNPAICSKPTYHCN